MPTLEGHNIIHLDYIENPYPIRRGACGHRVLLPPLNTINKKYDANINIFNIKNILDFFVN